MRRLAEHGATEKEIQGVSSHRALKEIAPYTAAASQKRLPEDAMGKLVSKKSGESVKEAATALIANAISRTHFQSRKGR